MTNNSVVRRRTLFGAALAATLPAAGLHAAPDRLQRILDAGRIRIAIDLSVPPWSFKDDQLQPTGSEVENAKLLVADLGVRLEIVSTNGADRIPLLMSDRTDIIMSVLTITPEREKVIAFSRPYTGGSIVIAGPRDLKIETFADLAGKRVAVTRGTSNDSDLVKVAPPGTQILRFDDEATTITAVVSGQAQLVVQAPSLVAVINKQNPALNLVPKLTVREFMAGVGLRKEDVSLKARIDQWIAKGMTDGKIEAAYEKFQGVPLPRRVVEAALSTT